MNKILIDAVYPQETRVVKIGKNNKIVNFDYESAVKKQLKGNIYLAKVTRVEPSLQAAFVEYGENKHGFLPFAEIHPDYYQMPAEDKKKLEAALEDGKDSDDLEDEQENFEKKKLKLIKNYKIQEVIKKNQVILVQVIKEERGNKGVSLSTYISLAGRYCVLMPNSGSKTGGVSKRIDDIKDRKRLRELIKSFNLPKGTSIILRTAVVDRTDKEITKDYKYLVDSWNEIRKEVLNSSAPALIYQEADIIKRVFRDLYASDVSEIVIEGDDVLNEAKKFVKVINPESVKKIKPHKQKVEIFEHYKVSEEIDNFYSTIAPLDSGSYLVINITEAMISIDVNSGKANKERTIEETALRTNLEAARGVARELQLRDLSGLIVIDFIDMVEVENRKKLERELRKAFENDKARVQFSRVSNFGLIEMSRQRLKPSLIETNMNTCSNCNGTGYVKSFDALAIDIFRKIRSKIVRNKAKVIKVFASPDCISYIINFRRKNIDIIEQENDVTIFLCANSSFNDSRFKVDYYKSLTEEDKERLSYDNINNADYSEKQTKPTAKNKNMLKKMLSKFMF